MPRRRAARHTLSRDAIVDRAIAVVDEHGPAGLTMRSLAQVLGVGPMALYTYFRSKDELLDAVRDRVLRELPQAADGPWDARLREVATALYRLLVAHPALTHLFATRPLAGHEAAEATEGQLRRCARPTSIGPPPRGPTRRWCTTRSTRRRGRCSSTVVGPTRRAAAACRPVSSRCRPRATRPEPR
jgi:AcrR family transcriptional regulator